MVGGDETELVQRLRQGGHQALWVGTARLRHYIPAERLTPHYLWRFHVGQGETQRRMSGHIEVPELFGLVRWTIRQYLVARLQMALLAPFKNDAWFDALRRAATAWGWMLEHRRQKRAIFPHGADAPRLPAS
jgi:hypothetical protein